MEPKVENCVENPLGILCKCAEYQKLVDTFIHYTIGTKHYLLPKINVGPIALAKVLWIKNNKAQEDVSKPILLYPQEKSDINATNLDRKWMPFVPDLIPLRSLKLRI